MHKASKFVIDGVPYDLVETADSKHVRSKNYNFDFNKETGFFARWGATEETKDDPQFSPIGPEILDLEISVDGCSMGCPFCSPAGAPVNTPDGMKEIQDIMVGDKVLGWNHEIGSVCEQTVEEVYSHEYDGVLVIIELEDGRLVELTEDHPVILQDGREIGAGELYEDDDVIALDGSSILHITEKLFVGTVYNFHCTPDEHYFSNGLLVHNCYKGNQPTEPTNMTFETFKAIFDKMRIKVVRVTMDDGRQISLLGNRVVTLSNGRKVTVDDLREGDDVVNIE